MGLHTHAVTQSHIHTHMHTLHTGELEGLINSTLVSLAATVRTDSERSVVIATLETLEDFLKSVKTLSFPMAGKALESLVVSVQDILEQKVRNIFNHLKG